jgi:hypothetical protein
MMRGIILAALVAALMAAPVMAAGGRLEIDVSNRPYLGPKDAPVTIIEFLDFQ